MSLQIGQNEILDCSCNAASDHVQDAPPHDILATPAYPAAGVYQQREELFDWYILKTSVTSPFFEQKITKTPLKGLGKFIRFDM